MKKKLFKVLLICMVVIGVFITYKLIIRNKMLKELDEVPVIFSVSLYKGENGTFSYDISKNKIDKISKTVFHSLSYDKNKEKIIGFVWDDEFKGMAELDIINKNFSPLISFDELKESVEKLGLEISVYTEDSPNFLSDISNNFIKPKYHKNGYTFIFNGVVYLIYKNQNKWEMKAISNDENNIYNYFLNEDELFLETNESIKKNGNTLLEIDYLTEYYDLMDMSVDMSEIVNLEKSNIFLYDVKNMKKRNIINHVSLDENVLQLRLSKDNRYIFYITGEMGFFGGLDRQVFYVVDTKTKARAQLRSWDDRATFYGFDW